MLARVFYQLSFRLTAFQKIASFNLCKSIFAQKDVLVEAVCGSGKTEITMALIAMFLLEDKKVAFACPRKTVVEQVYKYFLKSYPGYPLGCSHADRKCNLNARLIVLTCHQLRHYHNFFDLLIIDEADAFPFFNNFALVKEVLRSRKKMGRLVLLSATLKIGYFQNAHLKILKLYHRHHNFPVPMPVWCKVSQKKLKIITQKWIKERKPFLIFCPTIIQTTNMACLMNVPEHYVVNSKIPNYQKRIADFRNRNKPFLITTTILERGLTFKNVQVLVWNADHEIFSTKTLLQISGRVGRSSSHPEGEVYFLAKRKSVAIKAAFKKTREWNLAK